MLLRSTSAPVHQFWSDDISLLDATRFNHAHMHSHGQLTDLYLLGLAVKHKGRFVSFDQRIPLTPVMGAQASHFVTL